MMKTITDFNAYDAHRNEAAYSVFMFTTETCPDCAYAERFMPALETLYPTVCFYRVKRSHVLPAFQREKIAGVPSFAVYHQGERLGLYTDRLRKNIVAVKAFLDDTINHDNR